MKTHYLFTTTMVIMTVLSGCGSVSKENLDATRECKYYNICLVLDGSDRLSEQNNVPLITSEEIADIGRTLLEKGVGSLYVTYLDSDCDNNHVATLEWQEERPAALGDKPGYMKMAKYNELLEAANNNDYEYKKSVEEAREAFAEESNAIVASAYSDEVAKRKRGSDVNGAINKANKLLRASNNDSECSYIILVSDGCDNVGKTLLDFPPNTELVIVNSNVSKHQYGGLVSHEFVTLKQAIKYIFK